MSGTQWHESEPSDDDLNHEALSAARKRSSRACDQCRKTKSKCERLSGDAVRCKSCASTDTVCTFLGPSYKRGPPKGYIHAIEQRWHQVESLLGAILACPNPQVQTIMSNLRGDDLAREIIHRVDMGPFGPSGRLDQPAGLTKEDFFASIIRSNEPSPAHRETLRSRRQSRLSREIVSSSQDPKLSIIPTMEWQDRLSRRLASSLSSPSLTSIPTTPENSATYDVTGAPLAQRRRLDTADGPSVPSEWKEMYTMDSFDDCDVGDAAEAIGQLSLDENKEVRFHGKSSGLYLLSRSDRTDARREGGIWQLPMARVWPPSRRNMLHMYEEKDVDVRLPPINIQNYLLELYFTHIHPIFPVVHKSHFLREYNERQNVPQSQNDSAISPSPASGSPKPEPSQNVSKLLLLSMFAIAARFSEDEPQHLPQGKMWDIGCDYLDDARKILTKIFYCSRASTVQSLLLLGHREFGIGSMEQAWIYIGMAIRMAIDLGLNQNSDKWKLRGTDMFSTEEKQIRKQIWWTCCLADKYGSIYMGRPISIRESDFDCPLPDVIQSEDDDPWQPIPLPSIKNYPAVPGRVMSSFCAAASLSVIVGSIISKLYPVQATTRVSRQTARVELETCLDQWYIRLPENLRYDSASRRIVPPPQILFLHIRYWACVLLLHRAFIPNWKGEPASSELTLGQSTTTQSDHASLKAFDLSQGAASHISAIVTAYHENFSLKRSSPFLSSYILSAGIMHVLTLTLRPSHLQASLGLRQCMSALKVMELVWPSAFRAWDLLNGVKVRFDSALTPLVQAPDRHKRHADDAFGKERSSSDLQSEMFGRSAGNISSTPNANGVQDLNARMMAHMLGLDVPAMECPTPYYSGYEWWPPTNQNTVSAPPLTSGVPSMTPLPTRSGDLYFDQPAMDNWLQCDSETGPGYSYDLPSPVNSFSF